MSACDGSPAVPVSGQADRSHAATEQGSKRESPNQSTGKGHCEDAPQPHASASKGGGWSVQLT